MMLQSSDNTSESQTTTPSGGGGGGEEEEQTIVLAKNPQLVPKSFRHTKVKHALSLTSKSLAQVIHLLNQNTQDH